MNDVKQCKRLSMTMAISLHIVWEIGPWLANVCGVYCRLDSLLPGIQCAGGSATFYQPVGDSEKPLLLHD